MISFSDMGIISHSFTPDKTVVKISLSTVNMKKQAGAFCHAAACLCFVHMWYHGCRFLPAYSSQAIISSKVWARITRREVPSQTMTMAGLGTRL